MEGAALEPGDRVEQHALAQRGLAEDEAFHAVDVGNPFQHQRPGNDDVGPRRIEAGVERRSSIFFFFAKLSVAACSSLTENSKRLKVCSAVSSWAAWMMRAIVSAVPDDTTATSKPSSSTSRSKVASIERTYDRQALTEPAQGVPPGKNRSVNPTGPSFKLRSV